MAARISWAELREKFPEVYERERAREVRTATRSLPTGPISTDYGRVTCALREAEPGESGPWVVEIPGWRPPSLNRYLSDHWMRRRTMKRKVAAIIAAACFLARVPRATTRRRVSIRLAVPSGRHPDHDNITKALYDGLVAAGALVDDGPDWCETGLYQTERGELKTTIILEAI